MRFAIALVLLSSLPLAACASAHDDGTAHTEEDLALASLYGTWQGSGPLYTITFTKDAASTLGGGLVGRRFEVTFDTGVRCITTPCDAATGTASGVYKLAHGTELTLVAFDKPSHVFAAVLGDYAVKIKAGTLTLTKRDGGSVETFRELALHSPAQILAAAEKYVWPTREPGYTYRVFDTRAAAEAWGSTHSSSRWLAHDGDAATVATFVSGFNDLWAQEFTVDKVTLKITVTGEH